MTSSNSRHSSDDVARQPKLSRVESALLCGILVLIFTGVAFTVTRHSMKTLTITTAGFEHVEREELKVVAVKFDLPLYSSSTVKKTLLQAAEFPGKTFEVDHVPNASVGTAMTLRFPKSAIQSDLVRARVVRR